MPYFIDNNVFLYFLTLQIGSATGSSASGQLPHGQLRWSHIVPKRNCCAIAASLYLQRLQVSIYDPLIQGPQLIVIPCRNRSEAQAKKFY